MHAMYMSGVHHMVHVHVCRSTVMVVSGGTFLPPPILGLISLLPPLERGLICLR